MLLNHLLENSADKYPDKDAVWFKDQWTSYKEIEEKANSIAQFLIGNGIRKGDRISLLIGNSFDYIICYFGILKAGGVTVALNNELTIPNLVYYLENSESVALITTKKFVNLLSALDNTPLVRLVLWDDQSKPCKREVAHYNYNDIYAHTNSQRPSLHIISLDLASIVYTSGSTGNPKGVMLSHLNLTDNTVSIAQYLKITSADRMMVVLPFYYIYGNSLLTTHFLVGGSLVIDNRFMFPNVVIDTMKKTQVTGFAGVPSSFLLMLNKSVIQTTKIDSLRYVTQAGGAMAPSIQTKVAEIFSPAQLYIMYGTTEAAPRLTYLEPEKLFEKSGSIGKSIPNVDVYVANESGERLPAGETGEIVFRGSNMMMGYWKDAEATAAVIRNGIYFTGDLGKIDSDGYIFVVGRTKDMIKVGGNRVSSKEIEEALLGIDQIAETAVIGLPDPILGEAIKAYIVLKPDTTIELSDLKKRLSQQIASYKIPKFFEFISDLPKNESGKIMKEKLKLLNN
jgi:acyl-CoA synthetase (AMP-forming)/AMP-acid ligase II